MIYDLLNDKNLLFFNSYLINFLIWKELVMDNCIFCKIISGEIFLLKVYEDDEVLVFFDII